MHWYPLKLSFHTRSYAFGGRLIPEKLGKRGVPGGVVAETWEVSGYQDTSGVVRNGTLAGESLHALTLAHPDELVGEGWRGPHFPLLEKFLDASHMLPVHLHADDATAERKYGEPNGKTEAWHILWAAPGASVLAGIKPDVSRPELRPAFEEQDYDRVMPRHPVSAGDTVYVPGGVLHSFGPDMLIFEVQQTSDLSQTVMPADLYGNRLPPETWERNISETLDELRRAYLPEPRAGLTLRAGGDRFVVGCASPYFVLERWYLSGPRTFEGDPSHCLTLTNLGARVRIDGGAGRATETYLDRAESCILPAAMGSFRLTPEGTSDLIACYVPDLRRDVFDRLLAAGHAVEDILRLGDAAELRPYAP